jgi:hypothetical protein
MQSESFGAGLIRIIVWMGGGKQSSIGALGSDGWFGPIHGELIVHSGYIQPEINRPLDWIR